MGLVGTIQLAVTVAFALPVGMMGAAMVLDGRVGLGLVFVAVGVGMVVVQQYLTTPGDLPAVAVEKTVGRLAKRKDE